MRPLVAVFSVVALMLAALAAYAWFESREEPAPSLPEIEQTHDFAPVRSESPRAPSPPTGTEPTPIPIERDAPVASPTAPPGEAPAAAPEFRTRVHHNTPSQPPAAAPVPTPTRSRTETRTPSPTAPDRRTQIEKIQDAMTDAMPRFRMCYLDLLRSYPETTDRLLLTLEVGLDETSGHGIPSLAAIDSSELSAEDLECFAGVIGGLEFPPPVEDDEGNIGPYTIRYPLVIDPE